MSPDQAIAALDRHLLAHGQDVTLQRLTPGTTTVASEVSLRAFVSEFRLQEVDGMDGLQPGDSKAVISPSEMLAVDWPAIGADPLPRHGDRLVVSRRTRTIVFALPHRIAGEIVRVDLRIR
jgi:hypothetical protein